MCEKKQTKLYITIIFGLFVTACSNRDIYENIQFNNRQDCLKLPPSQYDECMETFSKSYDEYERERKEVSKDMRN